MDTRKKIILSSGIFLILIGLALYFLPVYSYPPFFASYPYRDWGALLVIAGMGIAALGYVISSKEA